MKQFVMIIVVLASLVGVAKAQDKGQQLYQTYCVACHLTGAAGAPKLGDVVAWEPRIEKGMDVLLQNAVKGIGAMPPKGLCASCTEDDLQQVINYMISQSKEPS